MTVRTFLVPIAAINDRPIRKPRGDQTYRNASTPFHFLDKSSGLLSELLKPSGLLIPVTDIVGKREGDISRCIQFTSVSEIVPAELGNAPLPVRGRCLLKLL